VNDTSLWLAIINAVAPTLAAIAACGAVWVSWRNGKSIKTAKEEIQGIRDTAKRSVEELDLMATGAHWKGYNQGVQDEKKRVSDFAQLDVEDWRG
jgi:gas vesicle protein